MDPWQEDSEEEFSPLERRLRELELRVEAAEARNAVTSRLLRMAEQRLRELAGRTETTARATASPAFEFFIPPDFEGDLEDWKRKIIEALADGGTYPSDFAAKHKLPIGFVLKAFHELATEGHIQAAQHP